MALDYAAIGQRIRMFRIKRGWKQSDLAEKSGVEPSNISHIERAATKLSLPTLVSIANALEVSLDEIVYNSLIKNKHIYVKEIDELVDDCDTKELSSIIQVIRTTKYVIRNYKRNLTKIILCIIMYSRLFTVGVDQETHNWKNYTDDVNKVIGK